jgi:hypothetical protein
MSTKLSILILAIIATVSSFAHDISGEWLGTRYQYDAAKSKYVAEFDYTYHLTQDENQIKGTATIKSKSGKVAEMAVRGFIDGDKFYFEEYAVINATRDENMLWCLKKGVLTISEENGKINLQGATPSFMEYYGMECSGGVTQLSKEKIIISDKEVKHIVDNESSFNISVYPNPFIETTTLSFTNTKSQPVLVDVVDIQGKVVDILENKILDKGTYTINYTPKPNTNASYYYIRIKMGEKTYTRPIQKAQGMVEMK